MVLNHINQENTIQENTIQENTINLENTIQENSINQENTTNPENTINQENIIQENIINQENDNINSMFQFHLSASRAIRPYLVKYVVCLNYLN